MACTLLAHTATAAPGQRWWSLPEVVQVLRDAYCGTLALEYKHLWLAEEQAWLEGRFEARRSLSRGEKAGVLQLLLAADTLENFLARRFPATKRCGAATTAVAAAATAGGGSRPEAPPPTSAAAAGEAWC
jgi:2-oxoglutarate dehydrogenase complex dehydrogenase (E1) component-like enzyme